MFGSDDKDPALLTSRMSLEIDMQGPGSWRLLRDVVMQLRFVSAEVLGSWACTCIPTLECIHRMSVCLSHSASRLVFFRRT
jgi:hypothetical protein